MPEWMVKGRMMLIQKYRAKGTVASNYRPIAHLPLKWKRLTGVLVEKLYGHFQGNRLYLNEQKWCRKRLQGMNDLLQLMDKDQCHCGKGGLGN